MVSKQTYAAHLLPWHCGGHVQAKYAAEVLELQVRGAAGRIHRGSNDVSGGIGLYIRKCRRATIIEGSRIICRIIRNGNLRAASVCESPLRRGACRGVDPRIRRSIDDGNLITVRPVDHIPFKVVAGKRSLGDGLLGCCRENDGGLFDGVLVSVLPDVFLAGKNGKDRNGREGRICHSFFHIRVLLLIEIIIIERSARHTEGLGRASTLTKGAGRLQFHNIALRHKVL